MPQDNTSTTPIITPSDEPMQPIPEDPTSTSQPNLAAEVASKIASAKNVLIALSSDPSVDEMATAIGLSLYLFKLGKRATAIYSGSTPNALEFLKPEETFEPTVDTLQDFVIAINKEKADHLRYKLDGDYVKIYITPYRTRLSEDDLDFSYGDFNVDLVLALDVANGIDLDSALREHGRIMHDAVIINITTGNPGKFGEIEWSDKSASSVSEMIADLLYNYGGEGQISKDEATAFLTGIVAATNRFSNARTTPATMQTAAKLMKSGANQQLVSRNITPDLDNELSRFMSRNTADESSSDSTEADDPTKLDIKHPYEEQDQAPEASSNDASSDAISSELATPASEVDADVTKKEHTLLDDLKAAEQNLARAGSETTPTVDRTTFKIEDSPAPEAEAPTLDTEATVSTPTSESAISTVAEPTPILAPEPILPTPVAPTETTAFEPSSASTPEPVSTPESISASAPTPTITPEPTQPIAPEPSPVSTPEPTLPTPSMPDNVSSAEGSDTPSYTLEEKPEKVIEPSAGFDADTPPEDTAKYGKMLQDALDSANSSPVSFGTPASMPPSSVNPATANAPAAMSAPEINGVPEMNYMPLPGQEILPPPPTPPIDMGNSFASSTPDAFSVPTAPTQPTAPIQPTAPAVPPMPTLNPAIVPPPASAQPVEAPQPASAPEPSTPPAAPDPGAFKIPGM